MAKAVSISLGRLTQSVQAAVKAATAKHPQFAMDPPKALVVSQYIHGFHFLPAVLPKATLAETQSFANDVAAQVTSSFPALRSEPGDGPVGACLIVAGHHIIGYPVFLPEITFEE